MTTFANCVIQELKTGTYTVTRTLNGTRVKGRRVDGAQSTFTIDAIVTPLGGHQLQIALDGIEWASAAKQVICEEALLTRTSAQLPDQVTINGEFWECISSQDWDFFEGTEQGDHYLCVVARRIVP